MLPNHAPLVIAEQFGTLESLYPGPHRSRPGPGAGHRHGDDARAATRPRGARRHFPQRRAWSCRAISPRPARAGGAGGAGRGLNVPIWLLGSSMFSAELAADGAALRLRVALRARPPAGGARRLPRAVQAVGALDAPYAMVAVNVSPRTPTPRRVGSSRRCSSSSSTCGGARPGRCRRRSTRWTTQLDAGRAGHVRRAAHRTPSSARRRRCARDRRVHRADRATN